MNAFWPMEASIADIGLAERSLRGRLSGQARHFLSSLKAGGRERPRLTAVDEMGLTLDPNWVISRRGRPGHADRAHRPGRAGDGPSAWRMWTVMGRIPTCSRAGGRGCTARRRRTRPFPGRRPGELGFSELLRLGGGELLFRARLGWRPTAARIDQRFLTSTATFVASRSLWTSARPPLRTAKSRVPCSTRSPRCIRTRSTQPATGTPMADVRRCAQLVEADARRRREGGGWGRRS